MIERAEGRALSQRPSLSAIAHTNLRKERKMRNNRVVQSVVEETRRDRSEQHRCEFELVRWDGLNGEAVFNCVCGAEVVDSH